MKKTICFVFLCDILILLVMFGMLMADKETLRENVIRLHVVANSDSTEDQTVKLKVKDAITAYLSPLLENATDAKSARNILHNNLDSIRLTADSVLEEEGYILRTNVTLCEEEFPTRHYDTFSLPSGVYESLRVTIGDGEGKNWWCVVFPSLCMNATSQKVEACAAGAGFSDGLTSALVNESGYEISFFFLDCIGRLEKLFFKG